MSGFQQKDMAGALFKNEEKVDPNHADYKGSITINGQEYWLDAWSNTAKSSGQKYFGLRAKLKEARGRKAPSRQPAPSNDLPFDDDIPF